MPDESFIHNKLYIKFKPLLILLTILARHYLNSTPLASIHSNFIKLLLTCAS
jgi:hypothetical protein